MARDGLELGRVVRDGWAIYRRHWRTLVVGAIAVYLPLAVLDGVVGLVKSDDLTLVSLESAAETFFHIAGDVVYAGLVAAAVLAWRSSSRRQRLPELARTLPWRTLVVLELVLPVTTVLLLVLLIVPGIVFYVWTVLAPAAAKVEHRSFGQAIRRSRDLVRHRFWRMTVVVLVVTVLPAVVEEVLQDHVHPFFGDVGISLIGSIATAPWLGLATVLIVLQLHDVAPDDPAPDDGAPDDGAPDETMPAEAPAEVPPTSPA
jgi:hypothetical protein